MAGTLNKVMLIGLAGRDPETRSFQNGGSVTTLSLATSDRWTDKRSGEKVERTEWHQVAIFNEALAEVVNRYVVKGSKLYIEGKLETRKWTDKDNNERYSTEVVVRPYNGSITLLGDPRGGNDTEHYPDDDVRDEPMETPSRTAQQPRSDRRQQTGPSGRR